MGFGLCVGALASCTFGVAPTPLTFLPASMVMGSAGPMGNMPDFAPFLNVVPFVFCNSPANPLFLPLKFVGMPCPCIPVPAGPWMPMKPNVMSKLGPLLNNDSMLMCAYGGMIKAMMPAQFTVMI